MSIRLYPQTIAVQMMAVLTISLMLLLAILALIEYLQYDTVLDTAEDELTIRRVKQVLSVVTNMEPPAAQDYLRRISHCHDGYSLSARPRAVIQALDGIEDLQSTLSYELSVSPESVLISYAAFDRNDFAYNECAPSEMSFPVEGIIVSVELPFGQWLNAEVHAHEWHVTPDLRDWLVRSATAFLMVGMIAFFFVRRLGRPLQTLATSASRFASGLEPRPLAEAGPLEVRRTIHAFNVMQRQVVDEVKRRTATLAAISHDIRSPLTALRLKAEMIPDKALRKDHIASIDQMERITSSALAYLRGEARNESKRIVDLGELVESECADIQDMGGKVTYLRSPNINYECRANALGRAIRNLIDNAVKYAGAAEVSISTSPGAVCINVTDTGPGIPADQQARVLRPFEQMSTSLDDPSGGFGLGLAIAKAIAEGHDGALHLAANSPTGLVATLRLPLP